MSRTLSILGREIQPGESVRIELEVARLLTRNRIQIPINIERAEEDGPVLLLIAGIHGDETNGVAIVRELISSEKNRPAQGTTISIPVFNVFGFLNQTRELPDGKDLNRVFPGSADGSLASQFAYHFRTEIAPIIDYAIDFHTGSSDRHNITQIRCNLDKPGMQELAMAFGAPFVIHSPGIPKSIREMLTKMGKKALLFEGGKTKSLDADVINYGTAGAVNVMRHLNMLGGDPEISTPPTVIRKTKWLRAPSSGLFFPEDVNGRFVEKRTLLGTIKDPYGEYQKRVLAPYPGHIICANTTSIVNRGDALFHMSRDSE
ncbi:MAG: succinylglutamate desuccinylase/aspartoacylase family protein [Bacteroidales bacterium]